MSVPIMSLYNYGSHGLDLSFLTHIFLLEPIHDSALMDQIVSRAFRCGARDSVRVITIVVWDTDATAGEKRNVAGCKVCDFCFKQGFPRTMLLKITRNCVFQSEEQVFDG